MSRPARRRRDPPPGRRPRADSRAAVRRRPGGARRTAATRSRSTTSSACTSWPRTRCCSRRPVRRCGGSSTGRRRPPASTCGPRPRSTACGCCLAGVRGLRRGDRAGDRRPPLAQGRLPPRRRARAAPARRRLGAAPAAATRRRRPGAARSDARDDPRAEAIAQPGVHVGAERSRSPVRLQRVCPLARRQRCPRRSTTSPGSARARSRAEVTELDGRPGRRAVDVDARSASGALSVDCVVDDRCTPPATARSKGFPLVGMMGVERRRHPRGHAGAARVGPGGASAVELLGRRARDPRRRPAPPCPGPALLLGLADHVVMTEDAYAFVSGPDDGGRVHRRHDRQRRARRRGRPTPATPARPRWWRPTATRATDAVARLLAYLPSNVDEEPPRVAVPTIPPIGRRPRPASSCRPRRPAATTCAA